jgi:F420-dependent oxidoreductase-like protein
LPSTQKAPQKDQHMKIGLQIVRFDWPGSPDNIASTLAEIAQAADQKGFASLWVMDHFFQMGGSFGEADAPMLEGFTTLGYLAAVTKQIRLGMMVTGVMNRHPGVLVKSLSTLDVLSGGRAYLGLGAGWYEQEAKGLGIPFPPLKERFERLEETIQIVQQMWAGDRSPHQGQHYHLQEPINSPQGLQQPHPPLLIGGGGEQKTLRMVAQYGDACNFYLGISQADFPAAVETVRGKLAVLKQQCEAMGRSYDAIEKTGLIGVDLTQGEDAINETIAFCRTLADLGIQHLIFNMPNTHEIKPLEVFGQEIIPAVAGL